MEDETQKHVDEVAPGLYRLSFCAGGGDGGEEWDDVSCFANRGVDIRDFELEEAAFEQAAPS